MSSSTGLLFQNAAVLLTVSACAGLVLYRASKTLFQWGKPGRSSACGGGCSGCTAVTSNKPHPNNATPESSNQKIAVAKPAEFFIPSINIGLRRTATTDNRTI